MKRLLLALSLMIPLTGHAMKIPDEFDPLGPAMRTLELESGRTIAYFDEGQPDWTPMVFVGGSGTSGRVFALLEFLRTLRENLHLRVIGVERNGFGQTVFDDSLGYADYAAEVEALLEHLGIHKFIAFAISGGGPYLTEIASRNADRLISVHLASALTTTDPGSFLCFADPDTLRALFTTQPMVWFAFPPESPIHRIPGFQDAAFDDAARTFNIGGQVADPSALHHEFQLYCNEPLADVSGVHAPVFVYHGEADTTVPPDPHVGNWQSLYAGADVTLRLYPDEGHDVQYRHWDQILVDMVGLSHKTLVCRHGKSRLVREHRAIHLIQTGGATLGICAWQH